MPLLSPRLKWNTPTFEGTDAVERGSPLRVFTERFSSGKDVLALITNSDESWPDQVQTRSTGSNMKQSSVVSGTHDPGLTCMDVRLIALDMLNLKDHTRHTGCGDKQAGIRSSRHLPLLWWRMQQRQLVVGGWEKTVSRQTITHARLANWRRKRVGPEYFQHTYEHFAATAAALTSQVSKCVRQVVLSRTLHTRRNCNQVVLPHLADNCAYSAVFGATVALNVDFVVLVCC